MNKIYTIGYGNLILERFNALLNQYDIETLIDIRSNPNCGRPDFRKAIIEEAFGKQEMNYVSWPQFGGFGLRSMMDIKKLKPLLFIAECRNTVIMCCESNPWRCHRALYVGRPIFQSGWGEVLNILANGKLSPVRF